MAVIHLLTLIICLCVVEVNSQLTFPYVSFLGQTLANHSYVDLSLVGDDYGSDSVQCRTDLQTCCSGAQGRHRGDWYFPNGDRLPFPGIGDIFETRVAQRVDLRRSNSATSPVGINRCDIPTEAVHSGYGNSVRATVYVGLYTGSGGMYVLRNFGCETWKACKVLVVEKIIFFRLWHMSTTICVVVVGSHQ